MIGAINSSPAFGATYQVRGKNFNEIDQCIKKIAQEVNMPVSIKSTGYQTSAGMHYNIVTAKDDYNGRFWEALKKLFGNNAFRVSNK